MHYIQKYILDKLMFSEFLRNRDMRPPNTESNLYQYHLKRLIDSGYVMRSDSGYTLSAKGLQYADKHSSDLKDQRPQPKLVTILRLEDQYGDVLLVKKSKQPYIGLYNLPSGKIHEGESLSVAGERELIEKVGIQSKVMLENVGSVHLTIVNNQSVVSESFGFVLKGKIETAAGIDGIFVSPRSCSQDVLMPGVNQILMAELSHQEILVES
jgi:CRISPR/Cas system-associated protein endoribonuclease Cas2